MSVRGIRFRYFAMAIARAESTGRYPHEEDTEEHKVVSSVPVQGFFRIWTRERNLDLLFVTLLAFARTEQAPITAATARRCSTLLKTDTMGVGRIYEDNLYRRRTAHTEYDCRAM